MLLKLLFFLFNINLFSQSVCYDSVLNLKKKIEYYFGNDNFIPYLKLNNQEYILPKLSVLDREQRDLIKREELEGSRDRREALKQSIYRKAYRKLSKIFDKNGRLTVYVGKQDSMGKKLEKFVKDYGVNITYKNRNPYINVKNDTQKLSPLLGNYISFFAKNNIKTISDDDAKLLLLYLLDDGLLKKYNPTNLKDLNNKMMRLQTKENQEKYENILVFLRFFLKNELYYNSFVKNLFDLGFSGKEKERVIEVVEILTNEFLNLQIEINRSLSSNKSFDGKPFYQLVFSINSNDIIMMSTLKNWITCSTLGDLNFFLGINEISHLSIIVYGTNNGDLANPLNRTLLKPYVSTDKTSIIWRAYKTYGNNSFNLLKIINEIATIEFDINENPNLVYRLEPMVYEDNYPELLNFDYYKKDNILEYSDFIPKKDWEKIFLIFEGDKDIYLRGLKYNGLLIEKIENPTIAMQINAVTENGDAIKFIENPVEDVQLSAIRSSKKAFVYIGRPTSKAIDLYRELYIKN